MGYFLGIFIFIIILIARAVTVAAKGDKSSKIANHNDAPFEVAVCPHCHFSFSRSSIKHQERNGSWGKFCPNCNGNMDGTVTPEEFDNNDVFKIKEEENFPKYDDDIIRYEGD